MKHVRNSYDNRSGPRGDLSLVALSAIAALACLGLAIFDQRSPDERQGMLLLAGLFGFLFFVTGAIWLHARQRYIDEGPDEDAVMDLTEAQAKKAISKAQRSSRRV